MTIDEEPTTVRIPTKLTEPISIELVRKLVRSAVLEERESCAAICEMMCLDPSQEILLGAARVIRMRQVPK